MANVNVANFANHTPVSISSLRNGAAADVTPSARESSIPAKFYYSGTRYFVGLRGNAATRQTECPAHLVVETQIRSAFATLVEGTVEERRVAAGGAAFDAGVVLAEERASANNRLTAIAIGAVHAAGVLSYELQAADLITSESVQPKLSLIAPPAAANDAAFAARDRLPERGWVIRSRAGNAAGALNPWETSAFTMAALSVDEVELAFGMMVIGQAAYVRAGAQLFADNHHYHSDADSSARHRAIEREVLGTLSAAAKAIWRANVMMLRNAVWHASIHSIVVAILKGFAEDEDMPERLDATGFGSMSVGLPAQEDLFNRAGSYLAVFTQVSKTAAAHGHVIDLPIVRTAVAALRPIGRGAVAGFPAQKPAWVGSPAAPWINGVDTRAKALKTYLLPILDDAEPVAAWMFSFYKEICTRASIRSGSTEGSLLRSYSLKRAIGAYLGEANAATEMFLARMRYVRAEGEKGNLETYNASA
jgi:hypothetical protein